MDNKKARKNNLSESHKHKFELIEQAGLKDCGIACLKMIVY